MKKILECVSVLQLGHRQMSTLSIFLFSQGYTRIRITYPLPWNVCDIDIQNSMVKAHMAGSMFLSLLPSNTPIYCGLDSSEGLFSYIFMCNPGHNEVNTGAKGCMVVVVVPMSFWIWGFLPPCLGESRTISAFSWEMVAFLLRWSSIRFLDWGLPLPSPPSKPKPATR